MSTAVYNAPDLARKLVKTKSASDLIESSLRRTPRWRYRRRAELRRALEVSRRRERQTLHLLGADVAWPYEYWPY